MIFIISLLSFVLSGYELNLLNLIFFNKAKICKDDNKKKESDLKLITKNLNDVSISEDLESSDCESERSVEIDDNVFGRVRVMRRKPCYKNSNGYFYKKRP